MQALVLSKNPSILPVVQQALLESGIETIRLDDLIPAGAMWASAISDAIYKTDMIVVDLSDVNANIAYELGFAHGLRKPTIILVSRNSRSEIPSDLAGFTYLLYDSDNLSALARELRGWLPSFTARRLRRHACYDRDPSGQNMQAMGRS